MYAKKREAKRKKRNMESERETKVKVKQTEEHKEGETEQTLPDKSRSVNKETLDTNIDVRGRLKNFFLYLVCSLKINFC
jgi:hypothetical protein